MAKRKVKDPAFQKMLRSIVEGTPEVPKWPFDHVTPEEWEGLPYRIRHNLNTIIANFFKLQREAN